MPTTPWSQVRRKRTPAQDAEVQRIKEAGDRYAGRLGLVRALGAPGVTQVQLAERLSISQAAVSQLEARQDAKVSTLREYVEALGGELHLVAEFPDRGPVWFELGIDDRPIVPPAPDPEDR